MHANLNELGDLETVVADPFARDGATVRGHVGKAQVGVGGKHGMVVGTINRVTIEVTVIRTPASVGESRA
jgi:hypothetical protein